LCCLYSALIPFIFRIREKKLYAVARMDFSAFLYELLCGDGLADVLSVMLWVFLRVLADYKVPDSCTGRNLATSQHLHGSSKHR
jgi:hypothetical protein